MVIKFFMGGTNLPRISPQNCGYRKCTPNFKAFRANSQDRYLLRFVISGHGTFIKNGVRHSLGANDLAICCPLEEATYIADSTDPWTYAWISFDCVQDFELFMRKDVVQIPQAKELFLQIVESKDVPAREWIICGLVYQLFGILSAFQDCLVVEKDFLREALTYIQKNSGQHLQVADIAQFVGMSRSHFSRLFKRQTGLSPQDYIVAYRLKKAAELLLDRKLTQKEICSILGYPDVSTFSKMFKRKYGISPGKYRQNRIQLPPILE